MHDYVRRSIDSLRAFHPQLRQLVYGTPPVGMRHRPMPGSWSIIEVIGHLIDAERVMRSRLLQICDSDNPVIEPFDQDAAVLRNGYQNADCAQLLTLLANERSTTTAFLDDLPFDAYVRTGWHQEVGLMRVDVMIEYLAKHDYEHYRHIHEIMRSISRGTSTKPNQLHA